MAWGEDAYGFNIGTNIYMVLDYVPLLLRLAHLRGKDVNIMSAVLVIIPRQGLVWMLKLPRGIVGNLIPLDLPGWHLTKVTSLDRYLVSENFVIYWTFICDIFF